MELEESSKKYLTINTHKGLFQYNRLVFGVASAPAKDLITSDKVQTHCNPDLPLRLACDTPSYGIGAVLSHRMTDGFEEPIAFASRSLNKAEQNYVQIDREGLSLVWGVKKFHQYSKNFTLITDHQPLVAIFNPRK